MASRGYYYDDYYWRAPYYRYGYPRRASSSASFHVGLFVAIAYLLGAASLYSRCVSAMERLFDQLRVVAVLSPLLLLLAAQCYCWAAPARGRRYRGAGGRLTSSLLAAPRVAESASRYWYNRRRNRAGEASSPWGVALVLSLVLLLVSYQLCFQDWLFSRMSRRR